MSLLAAGAVDDSSRPDGGFESHRANLAASLFIDNVGNRQELFHVRSGLKRGARHLQRREDVFLKVLLVRRARKLLHKIAALGVRHIRRGTGGRWWFPALRWRAE